MESPQLVALCGLLALVLQVSSAADAREWKDTTGKHSTQGEFVKVKDERVVLKKADGKTISVLLERLSKADRRFVKKQLAASRKADAPAAWSVVGGSVVPIRNVNNVYVDHYGNSQWFLSIDDDYQFVLASFDLKALMEEVGAPDKLAKKRELLKESVSAEALAGGMIRGSVALSEEDRKGLTGKYRLLDLEDMYLIDAKGEELPAILCHNPSCSLAMYGNPANLEGYRRGVDPDGCAGTIKAAGAFYGLLEVEKTLPITLLFALSKTADLEGLKIEMDGYEPVALKLAEPE